MRETGQDFILEIIESVKFKEGCDAWRGRQSEVYIQGWLAGCTQHLLPLADTGWTSKIRPPLSEGSRIVGNSPFTMNVLSPLIESFQSFSTVLAEDMRRASTRSAAPTRWLYPVFDRLNCT